MKKWIAFILSTWLWAGVQPAFTQTVYVVADEFEQMEVLDAFLQANGPFRLHILEQADFPKTLPPDTTAVIEFVHGQLSDAIAATIMEYTLGGGRTLVIHHGLSSGKKSTKGWYKFLGVNLDASPDCPHPYGWLHDVDFQLVNLQPNHYITSNHVVYSATATYRPSDTPSETQSLPALSFANSEVFINHQFTDGREKQVLFGFSFQHPQTGEVIQQDRSGWMKKKGRGWLFYLHPGHTVEDFKTLGYCQIIQNCLDWSPEK